MSDDDVARWQLEQEAVETMLDYSTPLKISETPDPLTMASTPQILERFRKLLNFTPYSGDAGDETE